ncbi:hypothetical protein A2999_01405 [Candidatus Wolfebacteria bacterium RIFCSPLOWO2_01_FULL_38_11]|uniref:Uncharacterized protein n=1 Tax=Candidatus Wolfebacteria bacterium RIFCSPLOWO2_01_FULL_38_11 TaxID=1802556 RepID=A0A1F8DRJ7_9BACT|nr:MAG: hypothetical protein A2999_01405 [Candidatus Wolfebacteria bacterium RIFCSPLOWO2_01_FULL_38_11]
MPSIASRLLGDDRIIQIYKKYNLTDQDKKVVEDILEEWDKYVDDNAERAEIFLEKTKNMPNHLDILQATLNINAEFESKMMELEEENNKDIH